MAHHDQVAYPVPPDMPISRIAADDVSALVAAVVTRPELAGANWPVSGMEIPSGPALAQAFFTGSDRPLAYYAMPSQEFGAILDRIFGSGTGAAAAEYQRCEICLSNGPIFRLTCSPYLLNCPCP